MPRIPEMTRDEVPEELRDAFDSVIAANGGNMPSGPGAITLHSPEMASRRAPLSGYMRSEIALPDRILELVILTTARCMDCPYVWNAHPAAARKAGVADALVDALREDEPLPAAPADEIAIVLYGLELMRTHAIRRQTFDDALKQFGVQHLVELTSLMGHYAQNAFLVNAFAVELRAGGSEPLLPVSSKVA